MWQVVCFAVVDTLALKSCQERLLCKEKGYPNGYPISMARLTSAG